MQIRVDFFNISQNRKFELICKNEVGEHALTLSPMENLMVMRNLEPV